MWLAAVCSLMNSVRADLAVAEAARDEARGSGPRGTRARRGGAAGGAGDAERPDPAEQRRHADPLGERRRLAEQRAAALALAGAARAAACGAYS